MEVKYLGEMYPPGFAALITRCHPINSGVNYRSEMAFAFCSSNQTVLLEVCVHRNLCCGLELLTYEALVWFNDETFSTCLSMF